MLINFGSIAITGAFAEGVFGCEPVSGDGLFPQPQNSRTSKAQRMRPDLISIGLIMGPRLAAHRGPQKKISQAHRGERGPKATPAKTEALLFGRFSVQTALRRYVNVSGNQNPMNSYPCSRRRFLRLGLSAAAAAP